MNLYVEEPSQLSEIIAGEMEALSERGYSNGLWKDLEIHDRYLVLERLQEQLKGELKEVTLVFYNSDSYSMEQVMDGFNGKVEHEADYTSIVIKQNQDEILSTLCAVEHEHAGELKVLIIAKGQSVGEDFVAGTFGLWHPPKLDKIFDIAYNPQMVTLCFWDGKLNPSEVLRDYRDTDLLKGSDNVVTVGKHDCSRVIHERFARHRMQKEMSVMGIHKNGKDIGFILRDCEVMHLREYEIYNTINEIVEDCFVENKQFEVEINQMVTFSRTVQITARNREEALKKGEEIGREEAHPERELLSNENYSYSVDETDVNRAVELEEKVKSSYLQRVVDAVHKRDISDSWKRVNNSDIEECVLEHLQGTAKWMSDDRSYYGRVFWPDQNKLTITIDVQDREGDVVNCMDVTLVGDFVKDVSNVFKEAQDFLLTVFSAW